MESRRRSQGAGVTAALASGLREEIEAARWFQGKGRGLRSLRLVDHVDIPGTDGLLAIVAAGYATGPDDVYLLALHADGAGVVTSAPPADPLWRALTRLATEGGSLSGEHGAVTGIPEGGLDPALLDDRGRQLEADQSNTSVVFDERIVLKVYRRLWPGSNPEQELLQGLTRVGSSRAPALVGGLTYRSKGVETTLASAYAYVAGSPVGWEPLIEELISAFAGPAAELERLARRVADLGYAVGELHGDLFRALGGERASNADAAEARGAAEAVLEDAVAAVRVVAPQLLALVPAARRELDGLARLAGTHLQRIHGDLHVAQLVRGPDRLVAVDFEGNPTVAPETRRRNASPLEDVAGLLLSLDHIAVAAARRRTGSVFDHAFQWSTLARDATLAAYDAAAPPEVPRDPELLRAFEVAREWREAGYAARVLPEWLYAPRLVLEKLLA